MKTFFTSPTANVLPIKKNGILPKVFLKKLKYLAYLNNIMSSRTYSLLLLFVMVSTFASAKQPKLINIDDFIAAIENNKLSGIANYFTESVSISVPQRSGNYHRKQGEQIIKDFFSNNAVIRIINSERKNFNSGALYTAKLVTKNGSFRITVFQIHKKSTQSISEISILTS